MSDQQRKSSRVNGKDPDPPKEWKTVGPNGKKPKKPADSSDTQQSTTLPSTSNDISGEDTVVTSRILQE